MTAPIWEKRPGLSQALPQALALPALWACPFFPGRDETARTKAPASGEPDVEGEVVVPPGGSTSEESAYRRDRD